MKRSMVRNGAILAGFALATTFFVSLTFQATKARIADQQQQQLKRTLGQIIPDELHDNPLHQHCVTVQSEQFLGSKYPQRAFVATLGDSATALAIETTAPDGYNGDIKLIVGIDAQGQVLGVRTLAHQETPGLGDDIELRKSDWVLSFNGKQTQGAKDKNWGVAKDGGQFDQFTGATITPRSYVKAVHNALLYFDYEFTRLSKQAIDCGDPQ
ncbi:electron transport complex subunit RsxG [Paraferrimonas sedimenticola]|uniref:Ion-translocating oxidoreductase complex subunit G n=1 Tax=Paraferrimonas sedimenticola TaxID=375674 RepID=A0AA37W2P0_9GAMM|nr:electron transport complex subunit RsxG [Paraferrimonas sedimenticola]GLP97888.1 electron transport complex subunit G [Paraferrimonas sedimenticola]